jgi:pyruvate dehydrogenase E2 component (dihydrolipoamide acetyltransferase)
MPKFGLTMTEGTIAQWLVAEGDRVTKDQPIAEIETEKIVNELVSPADGVMAGLQRFEGDSADVAVTMAWILQDGETAADIPSAGTTSESVAEPPSPSTSEQKKDAGVDNKRSKPTSSPSARRLAKELGVDLANVTGTGPGGRITKEDVQRLADESAASATSEAATVDRVEPWTPMRRMIIRSVSPAAAVPQLTLFSRADATRLKALQGQHPGVSYEDAVIHAVARTLRDHPHLNAAYTDQGVKLCGQVNIGLTVAVERGLMVPVIRQADRLTLTDVATERARLLERVASRRISPQDISDGTFTVSSLAAHKIDRFVALLNPPQAAILSAGRVQDQPSVEDGRVVVKPIIELGLTIDHRVLDGADGAAFMSDLVTRIESLTAEK